MRILYLTSRFPYPPLKGDQVVVYHRLRELGPRHRITLLTGYEHPADLRHLAALDPYCERIVPVRLPPLPGWLRAAGALPTALPFQVAYSRAAALRRAYAALGGTPFDIVHASRLAVASLPDPTRTPAVLDLIDSLSLNLSRRLELGHDPYLTRRVLTEEYRRARRYEAEQVSRYPATLVVSPLDAAALPGGRVHVVPNGVDATAFHPPADYPARPSLVFSGNWGYHPNVVALRWFLETGWARVRAAVPGTTLTVVGTAPPRWLRARHGQQGLRVTGYVPDMAAALGAAQVALAPMQSGSGIQNKILEAMACGRPVVTTSVGLGPIAAPRGGALLVADTADAFAEACIALLRDPRRAQAMGARAAAYVRQAHSWAENARRVEAVYESLRG
jgi:glycosyltransferase involved in cell wall biosynthesis